MTHHFHHHGNPFAPLKEKEFETLVEAIPLITLLIAGADGQYNMEETEWAAKVTRIRSFSNHESLGEYYEQVGKVFETRLNALMAELPTEVNARNEEISTRLEVLNDILPKLDPAFAARLYRDFRSFAKHVAKSSGGFLGMGSISANESKLISLHMIDPVSIDEEEE